ncbi:MAG: alpha/beta fold hydrolase [Hyphomonadaceae bacterium]|jgi:carboxylesterase|nr:alpha/beta fold hydrolase [Hyphomonadaceae bacterium]
MTLADHSQTFGNGPVGFLLIHGLGGTPAELRFVAIGLARAGYTVHCPQLAGHCGTFEELRATGWEDWYATVKDAHDELLKTCKKVIVGGLSMGAILALHLAAERPDDVQAAALFAPTLKLDGWGVPWYSVLFNLVRTRAGADLIRFSERDPYGIKDPRVRALVTAAINSGDSSKVGQLTNPGRVMLEMRWLVNIVKGELRRIRQPTLIVHPRHDDRASLRNAAYLQAQLGGMVDTCVLDDSYHVITIDRQRDLVVQRTVAFADSLIGRLPEAASRRADIALTHERSA